MVGLLVGTLLGGGVMFFVQRSVLAGDAARKEVVLEVIPKLDRVRKAIQPFDWDIMMSLDDQARSQRFQSMVKATGASWDSLYDGYELMELKMRMSFGPETADDFSKLVNELGEFRDAVAAARDDKRIGNKDLLLADTSSVLHYFTDLASTGQHVEMETYKFENRLLKR